jgi:hypothetical protein
MGAGSRFKITTLTSPATTQLASALIDANAMNRDKAASELKRETIERILIATTSSRFDIDIDAGSWLPLAVIGIT